jgi:hypothetical protein
VERFDRGANQLNASRAPPSGADSDDQAVDREPELLDAVDDVLSRLAVHRNHANSEPDVLVAAGGDR